MSVEVLFEERTFLSADGRTRVHGYIWRPQGVMPKAIIQLSHGMCEYVLRYTEWAHRFCEAGYVFCGNDHLGHGHTAPDEEELGFTASKNGAAYLVEDLHIMSAIVKAEFPGVPLVLYGHSMGSFAARVYLSHYGEELAAALISGTAGPEQPTGLALKVAHAVAAMKGERHRSGFLTSLAFGSYNKRFREENDVHAWLTRERSVREAYAKDPFCHFIFTAAGYDTLFTLLNDVSRKEWAQTVSKTLPVLLFAGEEDPVGNYGKGVRKIYERLQKAGCRGVQLRLYPEGRHEMHNETNRDEVFADLITFLEGTLA